MGWYTNPKEEAPTEQLARFKLTVMNIILWIFIGLSATFILCLIAGLIAFFWFFGDKLF